MVKKLLLLVSFLVICFGAANASAGGFSFWDFRSWNFHSWNFHSWDFKDDGRACNPIPEPSGALLFTAGGLVFAATKRRGHRK